MEAVATVFLSFLLTSPAPGPTLAVLPHLVGTAEHGGCVPLVSQSCHITKGAVGGDMDKVGGARGRAVYFVQDMMEIASWKTRGMGELINHKVSLNLTRQLKHSILLW